MRVLLVKDAKGIGRKGSVKDVKDGYARNFLIPAGIARPDDDGGVIMKQTYDAHETAVERMVRETLTRLTSTAIACEVKTGAHGEVFNSVTNEMIEKALRDKGFHDVHAHLEHPMKILGDHRVEVSLRRGEKTEVTVTVCSQPS